MNFGAERNRVKWIVVSRVKGLGKDSCAGSSTVAPNSAPQSMEAYDHMTGEGSASNYLLLLEGERGREHTY